MHELTAPDALRTLEHLVHDASHLLTMVIAARADPPLPLSRLMLEGRLQQIRIDELALTLGETAALFDARGLRLDPTQIASLHERSAVGRPPPGPRARARGERDPSQFVADTVGSEAVMSEYLMHEVLQRLPDDLQRFLLRTSVAQPLTVELAAELSDDLDAEAKLADLEHTGLFVTRSDQAASLYRFHSFLHRAPARPAPPRRARARAGAVGTHHPRWYDKNEMAAEAETHAFTAGEWKLGSTLACKRWVQGVLLGAVSGIDVELSPNAPRADVAELALLAAIDAVAAGDRRDATMWRTASKPSFRWPTPIRSSA